MLKIGSLANHSVIVLIAFALIPVHVTSMFRIATWLVHTVVTTTQLQDEPSKMEYCPMISST